MAGYRHTPFFKRALHILKERAEFIRVHVIPLHQYMDGPVSEHVR